MMIMGMNWDDTKSAFNIILLADLDYQVWGLWRSRCGGGGKYGRSD